MDESINYNDFQNNLETTLDRVSKAHKPLLVKREEGNDVVIMSKKDFVSIQETLHLLSSQKNAQRLMEAIHRDKNERIAFDNIEELEREIGI